jgi:hypothetical protein
VGRKNDKARKLDIFRIKSREGKGRDRHKTALLIYSGGPDLKQKLGSKRLHIRKYSEDRVNKVGEYNPLPKVLIEEFRRKESQGVVNV